MCSQDRSRIKPFGGIPFRLTRLKLITKDNYTACQLKADMSPSADSTMQEHHRGMTHWACYAHDRTVYNNYMPSLFECLDQLYYQQLEYQHPSYRLAEMPPAS